jgi:aspartyl-tRNA(Asn)/glutamyl-tRNA(Gln) amidotransferase subunit A
VQRGRSVSRASDNGAALAIMPADLCRLSAAALAQGYARGDFSPVEVTESLLARIDEVNGALNAIVTLDAAGARAAAQASETRWRARTARGPLDGVPLTVKDNINVRGLRTTWGSRLYADFIPVLDELPVARVREAGMVIVGKTNVPEFTLSGYTDNMLFGPTRNPWDLRLTPGGSSGGAVTAVAAGLGPLALGTDGGGSIRRPASHTGVVGLKPSRGRVARSDGLPQILLDFEVVGAMARTTHDVVLMMAVIGASDLRDPASAEFAGRPWALPAAKRCRVLYVPRFDNNPVDTEIATSVERAAQTLAGLGHAVTESAAPFAVDAFNAVWAVISQTGLAALLNSVPGWREQVSPPFVEMAEVGARLRATELFEALAEIGRMRERLSETFAQYDVVLTPTAAALPWPAQDAFPTSIAGREVGPRGHAVFTAFVNASGCPAISLPCTPSRAGLPIGFQLVAAPGHDERLCVLAHEYEMVAPWADRWPQL